MTPVLFITSVIFLPKTFRISEISHEIKNWHVALSACFGLWSGLIIGYFTEYYTSYTYKYVYCFIF